MRKLPQGEELVSLCKKIGISVAPISFVDLFSGTKRLKIIAPENEGELQRRFLEFKRARREAQLWIIALVSAIASVLSAVTAIIAVSFRVS